MDFISWDRMFGLIQSGRRVFGKKFTIRGMVKSRGIKTKEKPKTKKVFFLEETKSKKRFLEGKLRREVFKKDLNDLL